MPHHVKDVLLVGAGNMAKEYARVLQGMEKSFDVVGRGASSAMAFTEKFHVAVWEGMPKYLAAVDALPSYAIVAVNMLFLADVAKQLLKCGVKHILLEKPGAIYEMDFSDIQALAAKHQADVSIAYNRRFYASTREARKRIHEDGGVTSFTFEFTEWSHVIETLDHPTEEKHHWFLGNSSHVVDMALYLGGKPREINCFCQGETSWHPQGAVFVGAGITENNALFSYHANWNAPGRWGVEVLTRERRFVFRPLEKLQVQKVGSVAVEPVVIDNALDLDYKPGLYLETKAFLEQNEQFGELCSLDEQVKNLDVYKRIVGWKYRNEK